MQKIVIPRITRGLDKQKQKDIKNIIYHEFMNINIDLVICHNNDLSNETM